MLGPIHINYRKMSHGSHMYKIQKCIRPSICCDARLCNFYKKKIREYLGAPHVRMSLRTGCHGRMEKTRRGNRRGSSRIIISLQAVYYLRKEFWEKNSEKKIYSTTCHQFGTWYEAQSGKSVAGLLGGGCSCKMKTKTWHAVLVGKLEHSPLADRKNMACAKEYGLCMKTCAKDDDFGVFVGASTSPLPMVQICLIPLEHWNFQAILYSANLLSRIKRNDKNSITISNYIKRNDRKSRDLSHIKPKQPREKLKPIKLLLATNGKLFKNVTNEENK